MIRVKREIIDEICSHAIQEYPFECCGLVTGDEDHQVLRRMKNIQNELHAQDPVKYPRDARTAYFIDRSEFDRTINDAIGSGHKIIAFYHSHTDHDAYFSEEDVAGQTVFGEPEFPDALHLVVSVKKGEIHGIKCYRWDGREFIEESDFIV